MSDKKTSEKLKGKDLITIGIFSALYFAMSLLCNMLGGLHAVVWFLTPAIAAVVCSIPFMVMTAKVKKPFAALITAVIVGLIYLATGQFHIAVPVVFILGGLVAELIRRATRYRSFAGDACGYAFVSLGMAASPLPLWLDHDAFIRQISQFGMPRSYIETCQALTSPVMLAVMFAATIAGAFLGVLMTRALFQKHFKKAGVVG